MQCEPGPVPNQSNPEWQYGQPAPCRDLGLTWMCPGVVTPLLSWGLSLLLALLGGLAFAKQRATAVATTATVKATTTAPNSPHKGNTTAALPVLYALTDDSGTNGSGTELVQHAIGRPDLDSYMQKLSRSLDIDTATGSSANVLDVYVCGSETLQDTARAAYERHITPASKGSSFLGLQYAIG
jgi:hypothetical protein